MGPLQQNRRVILGAIAVALGLMIGLGLGLLVSRSINPLGASRADIASLTIQAKEEYIVLVGHGYVLDHNLAQARAQLEQVDAPNITLWLNNLIERHIAKGQDESDVHALLELAHGLGMDSPAVLAYVATLTPPPTTIPVPTETPAPTATPIPPTATATLASPTDTPPPEPTTTPTPPTPTVQPSDTPADTATATTPPKPTSTSAAPTATNPPAAKWTWSARLLGPGEENQTCTSNPKFLRVTVLNAAGSQIPNVWVYEQYTGQYRVTGHKGDDPYWGPGEAEFSSLDGGRVCIATGEGGPCESGLTRDLPCHSSPPFEDLWAAGYCECCYEGITKEECQVLFDEGDCVGGIGNFAWHVEFRRSR